jgi:hypothetical protein
MQSGPSDKSRGVALTLALVLGVFGGHRFYVGKTGTGLLMAATLGGVGLWYLYDIILVASGGFRDADGRRVSEWDPALAETPVLPADVLDELRTLRGEVAELAERLDFAERLLSAPRAQETAAERRPS